MLTIDQIKEGQFWRSSDGNDHNVVIEIVNHKLRTITYTDLKSYVGYEISLSEFQTQYRLDLSQFQISNIKSMDDR
jgi:uncharacterized membrane protein